MWSLNLVFTFGENRAPEYIKVCTDSELLSGKQLLNSPPSRVWNDPYSGMSVDSNGLK